MFAGELIRKASEVFLGEAIKSILENSHNKSYFAKHLFNQYRCTKDFRKLCLIQ